MAHLLNYKFEIFPTKPQRDQLYKILRQVRIQWNRAVTIRRKLKRALVSGQFDYIIRTILSEEKDNTQGQRRKAISKLLATHPGVESRFGPRLYDTKNLVGNILEDFGPKYLDTISLIKTLEAMHSKQVRQRKEEKVEGTSMKKKTKLTVYWQIMRAINRYAGYIAKQYMDKSFMSPKGLTVSVIRPNISGYANSIKWNAAVQPSVKQWKYGATGEPRYKRRGEGLTYQVQNVDVESLIRIKRRNKGHQIFINPLHKGNAWVNMKYHRQIPEDAKIKEITVNEHAGHFFVVFSAEIPEHDWSIIPMSSGWHAGIDPGAHIPLTIGLRNVNTGELRHMAVQYEFIDKSAKILEDIQQRLALKQGPKRKRNESEIVEAFERYSNKTSVQRMNPLDKEKIIEKEKARLETTMIRQESSKAWRELNGKVRQLQYRIANQRRDVLHKISRTLAEGCDLIGIGHWEPEREVSYRKKLRALTRRVNNGEQGAKQELEALKEEKTKQGPKRVKRRRRGGRDRSIATLRRLIEEKAQRSGVNVFSYVNEAKTTLTCSICGLPTGPRNDMSVREWRCKKCNTVHNRDLNAAFNILSKAEEELTAAQAEASATEPSVTRTKAQGATGQPESNFGFRATGSRERGGPNFTEQYNMFRPVLWEEGTPNALKSLIQMGIVSTLPAEKIQQNPENPP
jgi:transposase